MADEEKFTEAAELIGTPPSGGPTLLMADEIFCSEAWARFDPAEVARRGAGSYELPRELANATQAAAFSAGPASNDFFSTTANLCVVNPFPAGTNASCSAGAQRRWASESWGF